jgi:hypothetical protein
VNGRGISALTDSDHILARPERFELPTYSSGGCRSIQLSYGRAPRSVYIRSYVAGVRWQT